MKQVKRSVSLIFLASLSLGGPVEALDRPAEYPPAEQPNPGCETFFKSLIYRPR